MANKKNIIGMLVMILTLSSIIAGCGNGTTDDNEPTYTVWTFSGPHAEFSSPYPITLVKNEFVSCEFFDSQFSRLSLPDENKHVWTEIQIYNWFIDTIYNNTPFATEETEKLITRNHGYVAARNQRDIMYMLIK